MPRGDVGGDEGVDGSLGERGECALALTLRAVAVDRFRTHSRLLEPARDLVGAAFRLAEDDRGPGLLDHVGAEVDALVGMDAPEEVGRARLVGGCVGQLVAHRVALVAAHEGVDRAVERRREQQRLTRRGRVVEQALDDREEAHVGHAVGFVDDDDLDRVEADLATFDEVGEAAGTRDEHVDTAAERLQLRPEAGAAVDRGHAQLALAAEPFQLAAHLGRELAGGDEDEAGGALGRGFAEPHDERDAEGDGLARSGRGAAAEVAPGATVGEGEGLDGEGREDPARFQGGDELRGHAEIGEGRGHVE